MQKKEIENTLKLARNHEDFNLEIPGGFIYCAGGILCKLIDTKQFIAINGRWVECMN